MPPLHLRIRTRARDISPRGRRATGECGSSHANSNICKSFSRASSRRRRGTPLGVSLMVLVTQPVRNAFSRLPLYRRATAHAGHAGNNRQIGITLSAPPFFPSTPPSYTSILDPVGAQRFSRLCPCRHPQYLCADALRTGDVHRCPVRRVVREWRRCECRTRGRRVAFIARAG